MVDEKQTTTTTNEATPSPPAKDRSTLGFWMVFCPFIAFCLSIAVLVTHDYLRLQSFIEYWYYDTAVNNNEFVEQGTLMVEPGRIGFVSNKPIFSNEEGKYKSEEFRNTYYYARNGEDVELNYGDKDAYWTAATVFACLPVALIILDMALILVRRSDADSRITPQQAHAPGHSVVEAYLEDRVELSWSLAVLYMLNACFSLLTMLSFGSEICKDAREDDMGMTCYEVDLEFWDVTFMDVGSHREQLCIEGCKPGSGVALAIVAAMFWMLAGLREILVLKVPARGRTTPTTATTTTPEAKMEGGGEVVEEEEIADADKPHMPDFQPTTMID